MKTTAPSFFEFLDLPLRGRGRLVLCALVIPLLLSFAFPLWNINMIAPQYPKGLQMDIWSYQLVGGNNGNDIQEINTLNHYIGMKHLDRTQLSDLDWLPFGFGVLALMALRVAAIGTVRSLIDLTVFNLYVCTFAFVRFVYKLYIYGHELDPTAPVKVQPFTPAIFGTKQIANFTTHSYPGAGGLLILVYAAGITLLTFGDLWDGRRRAVKGRAPG